MFFYQVITHRKYGCRNNWLHPQIAFFYFSKIHWLWYKILLFHILDYYLKINEIVSSHLLPAWSAHPFGCQKRVLHWKLDSPPVNSERRIWEIVLILPTESFIRRLIDLNTLYPSAKEITTLDFFSSYHFLDKNLGFVSPLLFFLSLSSSNFGSSFVFSSFLLDGWNNFLPEKKERLKTYKYANHYWIRVRVPYNMFNNNTII